MRAAVALALGAMLSGAPGEKRFQVRGEIWSVVEPCGDEGQLPRPLPKAKVRIIPGATTHPDDAEPISSDEHGRFALELPPGTYCAMGEHVDLPGLAWGATSMGAAHFDPTCVQRRARRCDAVFQVDGADADVDVYFVRSCGDTCVRGDPSLPLAAKGVGRVAATGGIRHVRGTVTRSASWWSGVPPPPIDLRRPRKPDPGRGERVRVVAGDANEGGPPVAEVVSDELGAFDIALPQGTWCLVSGFREAYFHPPPVGTQRSDDIDDACIRKNYATCDQVVRLEAVDVEGAHLHVHQWSPADAPCRTRPYRGPYPP